MGDIVKVTGKVFDDFKGDPAGYPRTGIGRLLADGGLFVTFPKVPNWETRVIGGVVPKGGFTLLADGSYELNPSVALRPLKEHEQLGRETPTQKPQSPPP
jgi:hypothetical protein